MVKNNSKLDYNVQTWTSSAPKSPQLKRIPRN